MTKLNTEKENNIQKKSLDKSDTNETTCYIYERNPDTGEIFRRKKGDYTTKECINPEVNAVPRI
jgi:hypothetical protein